jgi:predicted nucleic acid-binding protein
MVEVYWDASALVKRYASESGTPFANAVFTTVAPSRMMCLSIGTSEIISVFVRKRNAGLISQEIFAQALVEFRAEVIDSRQFRVVATTDNLIFASHPLIERYSLNATDAVILRSAVDAANVGRAAGHDLILLTSDDRLLRAARHAGIGAFNPEADAITQFTAALAG